MIIIVFCVIGDGVMHDYQVKKKDCGPNSDDTSRYRSGEPNKTFYT